MPRLRAARDDRLLTAYNVNACSDDRASLSSSRVTISPERYTSVRPGRDHRDLIADAQHAGHAADQEPCLHLTCG